MSDRSELSLNQIINSYSKKYVDSDIFNITYNTYPSLEIFDFYKKICYNIYIRYKIWVYKWLVTPV